MNLLKNWNKPSKRDTPFLFVGGGSCRIIFNFRSLTLTPSFDTLNPKYSISSMANSVLLGLADKEFSRNLQNCFHIFQIFSPGGPHTDYVVHIHGNLRHLGFRPKNVCQNV